MKRNECKLCTNVIPPTGRRGRPKAWCAECESAHGLSGRSGTARRRRTHHLLQTYGLTLAAFEDMYQAQGGLCDICGVQMSLNGLSQAASTCHVDHDHCTGAVRALLCLNCNQGIGKLMDDPELLEKAAEYLRRHEGY